MTAPCRNAPGRNVPGRNVPGRHDPVYGKRSSDPKVLLSYGPGHGKLHFVLRRMFRGRGQRGRGHEGYKEVYKEVYNGSSRYPTYLNILTSKLQIQAWESRD